MYLVLKLPGMQRQHCLQSEIQIMPFLQAFMAGREYVAVWLAEIPGAGVTK